jgi:phospholipase C
VLRGRSTSNDSSNGARACRETASVSLDASRRNAGAGGHGRRALLLLSALGVLAACTDTLSVGNLSTPKEAESYHMPRGLHKIDHIIIVMQENRSFDHYFGTFPGADGIPMKNGVPNTCIPNPAINGCTRPWHDPSDVDHGGPHTAEASHVLIKGKMDEWIALWDKTRLYCNENPSTKVCLEESRHPDVVGYHNEREIPNYWAYAKKFVLQDHMFEPNRGWSQPAHLALVSGWSAYCTDPIDPATCSNSIKYVDPDDRWPGGPSFGWTDLTYLLHERGVSWRYYVAPGTTKDCEGTDDETVTCEVGPELVGTPEAWNPLPDFTTVRENKQVWNVTFHPRFFRAARRGSLPSVSWIVPGWATSEHPPELVSDGEAWVTRIVNAVMRSPNWKSSAIFVSWDDWGGFYDHLKPPRVDGAGYGIRVPGLLISPYAKRGYIDHQTLSFDAYLKLIEDRFLEGQRIDPETDGRWDPRPNVREDLPILGDLIREFDFSQRPRRPLILPPNP